MTLAEQPLSFDDWERLAGAGAFEQALAALRAVVGHLESGQLLLDDAVRCYEVGTLLARRCEHLLDEAELRVTRLDRTVDESEPVAVLNG